MEGAGRDESADESTKWSAVNGDGLATKEEAETKRAAGGGGREADGNGMGDTVERRTRTSRVHSGRRE